MRNLIYVLTFILSLMLISCGEVQSEYYKVHVIVVEDNLFYYIDPSEGKDTFSANQFGSGEPLFIYLYEANDNIDFSYDQYFQTIQNRYVETNLINGELYVHSSDEIDQLIHDYFINKPE